MRADHGLALGVRCERQDDVGAALDGRGDPAVGREDEVELDHGVMPALGLGGAGSGKQVGRCDEATVNLVRLARLHRLEREVGMRVEHHTDIGGILVQANDLVLQLGAELLPAKAEVSE